MEKDNKVFVDAKSLLGRKVDFDLKRLKQVYGELTDYLGMPIEQISRDYWSRRETIDKQQQRLIENATTEEIITEYYSSTEQYLYELASWEAQKDKQREFEKICLFCKKFKIKRILDFGGGVGGLSIFLNNRGFGCHYLDILGETYNFAKWRFNRHKINLKIFGALEEPLPSYYDAVIAYDVFEHIFDLPTTIKQINKCLKSGGYLIGISTFSGGGLHLLKNEIYQRFEVFDSLLTKNGFKFLGQLKIDRFSNLLNRIGFNYIFFSIRLRERKKHGGNLIVHKKVTDLES